MVMRDLGGADRVSAQAKLRTASPRSASPTARRFGLATVVGQSPRVFFIKGTSDMKGCPAETDQCHWRAFIVPGDRVFTAQKSGGFVCASFVSRKGLETAGWLPAASLKGLPPPAPAAGPAAWVGVWQGNIEQRITIRREAAKDMLSISGEATFGAIRPRPGRARRRQLWRDRRRCRPAERRTRLCDGRRGNEALWSGRRR